CGALTSLGCATTSTANPNFGEVTVSRSCAAETLYVRVTGDGNSSGKFQLCIEEGASSGGGGATCATAVDICSLPFSQTGMSTAGAGNDYDSLNAACHDPFMNGSDFVYSFTPAANICAEFQLNTTGINPGLFIFDGCPNTGGTNCIASVIGNTG